MERFLAKATQSENVFFSLPACVGSSQSLTRCAIDPLGPIGKGSQPPPAVSKPQPDGKFAWGISTAAYQYENPDVTPGEKDYFLTDWDTRDFFCECSK